MSDEEFLDPMTPEDAVEPGSKEAVAMAEIEAQRELVRKAREAAAAAEAERQREIEAQKELIKQAKLKLEATKAKRASATQLLSPPPKAPVPRAKPTITATKPAVAATKPAVAVTKPAVIAQKPVVVAASKPVMSPNKPAPPVKPSFKSPAPVQPRIVAQTPVGRPPPINLFSPPAGGLTVPSSTSPLPTAASPTTPTSLKRSASRDRVLSGDLNKLRDERRQRSLTASKTDDIYRRTTVSMRKRNEEQRTQAMESYEVQHQSKLEHDASEKHRAAELRAKRLAERQRALTAAEEQTRARISREIATRKSNEARRTAAAEDASNSANAGGEGQVNGYHEMEYANGHVYRGEWNSHGNREGVGSLTTADGAKYSGGFGLGMTSKSEGLCNGLGVMIFPDAMRYEGEYNNNKPNGFGILVSPDGCKYEGQFVNGAPAGFGLFTLADGSNGRPRLEGEWEDGECVRRCAVSDIVKEAQIVAGKARFSVQV